MALKDKLADAEVELANIVEESAGKQTELQNTLNSLIDEQRQKIQDLKDEYDDIVETLKDALFELEFEDLTPPEKLQKQAELAIAEFEKMRDKSQQKDDRNDKNQLGNTAGLEC